MRYSTEKEILDVVEKFENGTIRRDEWRHTEHLTVALFYILRSESLSDAIDKMRRGIFKLLASSGVDLSKEMPYHETLTVFWMRAAAEFAAGKNVSFVEQTNALIEKLGDKDFPLRFYSRELLFSTKARAEFVEPDRQGFENLFKETAPQKAAAVQPDTF